MSGVLRPVGPEPVRVYWLRRVIVAAAAVLALVVVIAIVVNLNSPANASGPEAVPPVIASSPPPSAAVSAPTTPSPAAASPSTAKPTSPPSSSPASPTSRATPTPKSSSAPAAKRSTKARTVPSAKPSPAEIAACDPAQLRPTLTGKQRVTVKTKTNLDLSLINGESTACRLALSSGNFSLTIYSGRDRIWSTDDCTDLVKPVSVKIASEDAYEWRIVWDGRRSKKSCQSRPEIPKPGTYVATAQFKGTDPVRFRMFVKN